MLCCAVYEGWSHLSCMGMKEGVGVMVERQLLAEEQMALGGEEDVEI